MDSRKEWDEFIKRSLLIHLYPDVEQKSLLFIKNIEESRHSRLALKYASPTAEEEKATKRIQQAWQHRKASAALFFVSPTAAYSKEMIHLINRRENIKKDLHPRRLQRLLSAITHSDWNDKIFSDKRVLELAIGLFSNHKISQYQLETIIKRSEITLPIQTPFSYFGRDAYETPIPTTYSIQAHKILNDNGDFTEEAKNFILPHLPGLMYQDFNILEIDRWRSLLQIIAEDSPSENIFFMNALHPEEVITDTFAQSIYERKSTLRHQLKADATEQWNTFKITLSRSARDACRVACFGADAIPTRTTLGVLEMSDIAKGVVAGFRETAGHIPFIPANIDYIHGYSQYSLSTISDHDDYHADMMSRQGTAFRQACIRSASLIEEHLFSLAKEENSPPYSVEAWQCYDAEFFYFNWLPEKMEQTLFGQHHIKNMTHADEHLTAAVFSEALIFQSSHDFFIPLYVDKSIQLTDAGIVCLVDMVKHRDDWRALGLNPTFLTQELGEYYQKIESLHAYLNENPISNILLFRIYEKLTTAFPSETLDHHFMRIMPQLENLIASDAVTIRNCSNPEIDGQAPCLSLLQKETGDLIINMDLDTILNMTQSLAPRTSL